MQGAGGGSNHMQQPQANEGSVENNEASARGVVAALLRLSAIPKDNWEECIQQVLQVDSEVLGLGRVSYWSLRRDPTLLHCEMGYISAPRAFERGLELLEADYPAYFRVLERSHIVEIEDVRVDPRTAGMCEYLGVRCISSLLDIPICSKGTVVGMLCHEHTGSVRRWTAADREFAMAVAQIVAAALEAHARGEAERAHQSAAFLDRVSRKLGALRDVREVAQAALACAIPDFADWGVIDVIEHGELVHVGAWHRTPEGRAVLNEIARRFPPPPDKQPLSARAMELGQAVLIPDMEYVQLTAMGVSAEHEQLLQRAGTRSVLTAPLLSGDRTLGVIVLARAERAYRQADLRLAEDLAQRVAAAVENARLHAAAQDAIRARDEFIALAAHELHGPLASLQLAAESLAARVTTSSPESIARMSQTVVRQTQRLNRLVDHMLDASRVMSKRLAIIREYVDLGDLVREIALGFEERLAQSGSTLRLDIEDEVAGEVDGDRLVQVVNNLLDNAIKFGAGEPIELSLRTTVGEALLKVEDHGIGIPPDRIASIFDPFERAVSPRRFGGLGLGLFTANAIVRAHGGTLSVESHIGRGTTFTMRVPLHQKDSVEARGALR